jgi:uncharacterized protein YndB with AHSA1/START domain
VTTKQLGAEAMLQIKRTYEVPREKVFRAWTEPTRLMKWFCPEGYENPGADVDLRVGGSYRILMRKLPDGEPFAVGGKYIEVSAPSRLVFTWQWEGKNLDPAETVVTVELRKKNGTTELTLTHERFPDEELRDRHNQGWCSCLDRFASNLPQLS